MILHSWSGCKWRTRLACNCEHSVYLITGFARHMLCNMRSAPVVLCNMRHAPSVVLCNTRRAPSFHVVQYTPCSFCRVVIHTPLSFCRVVHFAPRSFYRVVHRVYVWLARTPRCLMTIYIVVLIQSVSLRTSQCLLACSTGKAYRRNPDSVPNRGFM